LEIPTTSMLQQMRASYAVATISVMYPP